MSESSSRYIVGVDIGGTFLEAWASVKPRPVTDPEEVLAVLERAW